MMNYLHMHRAYHDIVISLVHLQVHPREEETMIHIKEMFEIPQLLINATLTLSYIFLRIPGFLFTLCDLDRMSFYKDSEFRHGLI